MLRNQDEDELNELLSQTYANSTYMDKQIQELLTKQDNTPLRHIESSQSIQSSNHSQYNIHKEEEIASFQLQKQQKDYFQSSKSYIHPIQHSSPRHIFHQIYQKINLNLKADTIETVRHKYPLFLLSQPNYQIKDHIKSVNLSFTGNLLRKNIIVMDVGYCQQQKVFKVAVGTDEGTVVIFQPSSSKPQHIIECFSKPCTITCVKWSKNLQYLAISNDQRELNVYSFKQPINIENNITFRILKSPTQYCSLGKKLIKNMITELNFISQNPFKMIIVVEGDEIFKFQMKKNYITTRPALTTFSLKFSKFFDLNFHTMKDSCSVEGVIMAVSNQSHITFCQIEPSFEVAMVFDKQKHGSTIKKSGFPHVSFRSQPNSVLVIWDKYLQIMSIDIEQFSPFKHRFSITHKFLLPDSTIIGGFLSNTLIYQVNRVGIKIYSTTSIQKDINQSKTSQIYFQKINFQQFCYGDKIQQFISNQEIQVANLRYLKGLFKSINRNLFYTTNKGVQIIYFNTLHQYVNQQIQNNNWKIALQVLKDCYLGKIHELDQIHQQLMQNKIKQLSNYNNFSQQSRADHMQLLWNQELIFIFNILIATDLQLYLLQSVLHKIYQLNQLYIQNIIPFILINKIQRITHKSLELLIQHIPIQFISKLIFNMQTINNEQQLPHQINNLLIKHELFLEFIDLNQKFKDFYTPVAVLVGIYLRVDQSDMNLYQSTSKKSTVGKLIAYSVYETLTHINFSKDQKEHSKNILDSIIRLLMDQIFTILVREEPIALFQNIIEQLYMGNCLEVLNQLDVLQFQGDLMKTLIQSISYEEVIAYKCQKRYWIAIFKLYSRKIIMDLQIYEGLRYLTIQDHIEQEFISKFVAKCQEQIRKELQNIPIETVENLFQALQYTNHISLVIMIGTLLRRYITTLQSILSDSTQRNQKIYDFIYSFITKLTSNDIKLLRELFKKHIKFFIDINAEKACDIICKYYLADLNIFVDDLDDYPLEQIKLIRSVLQLYSYAESLIGLKVRYLQLLASNRFHDVILVQLKKQNYPLDESLQICKKYDVLQALAYLLVKSGGEGNTDAAIRVYFRIISQKVQKLVTSYHGDVQQSDMQEIIVTFVKKCIQICQDLDLKFHHHYENQWFVILQELQLLKKSILRSWVLANNCEMLKNIINKKAYPQLIQSLISQIELDQFVLYLKAMMSKFDLQALQIIIQEMMKNYLYEKRIFIISQMLLIQSENHFRSRVYKKQLQGFATNCICSVCNQKGELLIHYGCGHENHPSCSHDVKQCVLCEKQAETIYRKRIDNVTGLRIDIYSSGIKQDLQSVQREIKKQDKIKRMQLYEDLSFVDL